MLYLLAAILCSTAVSVLMRMSEDQVSNKSALYPMNYAVCLLLALFLSRQGGGWAMGEGRGFTLGIGMVNGLFYLISLVMYQWTIHRNGVVLSATFMKLGVLVPTLMAIAVFREEPKAFQIIGIVIALTAIVIMQGARGERSEASSRWLLILLLVTAGFTDAIAGIFEKYGASSQNDSFLIVTFITALVLSVGRMLVKKEKPGKAELLYGACIGIPNYGSARFLLLALGKLPTVMVYPVYNAAVILVIGLVGAFVFRERLTRQKLAGFGLILAALVLLNL